MFLLRVLTLVCLATVTRTQTPDVPGVSSNGPQVVSDSPVIPPSVTNAPVIPAAATNSPVIPAAATNAPVIPAAATNAPVIPPVATNAPVIPPAATNAPVIPPAATNAPVIPPAATNAPVIPPAVTNASVIPPAVTNAPAKANATAATTKVPETTTTHATSSPSPPHPYPSNRGMWNVTNAATPGSDCILFQAAIRLELPLSSSNGTMHIDVPANAEASGSCETDEQMLTLKWEDPLTSQAGLTMVDLQNNTLDIVFDMNNSTKKYTITSIHYSANAPGSATPLRVDFNVSQAVEVSANKSYRCNSEEMWLLSNSAVVHVKDIQYEAFRPATKIGGKFSDAQLCNSEARDTVTIIGILIGGTLAVVVILTLGLYLGKRYGWCNRRAAGYQPLDGGLDS